MPRRTEPKGAHKALLALVQECEIELNVAGDRISNARVRAETARRALNIYEEAVEQEAVRKRGPRNVHKLSNVG